jgi:hypothetical protein
MLGKSSGRSVGPPDTRLLLANNACANEVQGQAGLKYEAKQAR